MAGIRVFASGVSTPSASNHQSFGASVQSQAPTIIRNGESGESKPVAKTSSSNPKRRSRSVMRDVLNSAT